MFVNKAFFYFCFFISVSVVKCLPYFDLQLDETVEEVINIFDQTTKDSKLSDNFLVHKQDVADIGTSKQKQKGSKNSVFNRILPMLIIPYLVQSAILPMILLSLKTMMIKSLFIGKLAIAIGIYNALRSRMLRNDLHENDEMLRIMKYHYGYGNAEEFGAYFN